VYKKLTIVTLLYFAAGETAKFDDEPEDAETKFL